MLLSLLNRRDVTDTSSSYGREKPQCPDTGKNGLFVKRQLLKTYERLLYIVAFEWSKGMSDAEAEIGYTTMKKEDIEEVPLQSFHYK